MSTRPASYLFALFGIYIVAQSQNLSYLIGTPMRLPLQFSLLLLSATASQALEIRNYSPSRHDRFVTAEDVTTLNPDAYYDSSLYTAVGFSDVGAGRQYALVTPEHVLFAKHFTGGHTSQMTFINASGQTITRTPVSTIEVPNGSGGEADVIILKLNAPISDELGIKPLPYLNLATEALYNNTVITMFGNSRRAGRGVISGFNDYSNSNIDIDTTRHYFSTYTNIGNQDDAYLEIGDSGSPSFATANGSPALVGVHLATSFNNTTLDTFIPEYAEAINTLLSPEGYALIPANTETVSLSKQITNDPLRQTEAASIEIDLSNSSANTATNPRLNLFFPTDAIPTSVSAPGWIVDNPAPGDYRLRSATLSGNSSVTATITYTAVPSVDEISIQATHFSDGSSSVQETYNLPVTETFAGFTTGLTLTGELDDPDFDGISNLLEYAFGGNPGTNSNLAEGGYFLSPQSSQSTAILTFTYARRTNAATLGLIYETEFSETLDATPWSTTLPSGASSSAAPFDPDVPGYEQVSVSIPTGSPDKNFVRVNVTLSEP
ncbi:MAG: trypsin-like serine protease [Luteolibacter sp.]